VVSYDPKIWHQVVWIYKVTNTQTLRQTEFVLYVPDDVNDYMQYAH